MTKTEDDAIDVLKFFIGVMCLLTLVVAGFAVLNYTKMDTVRTEAQDEVTRLGAATKIASDDDFQNKVMLMRERKTTLPESSADLAPFLQELSHRLHIYKAATSWTPTNHTPKKGFLKRSMTIAYDGIWTEEMAKFLFYAEQGWPGLKLEELRLAEYKEGHGWKGNTTVALYRPDSEGK